MAGGCAGVKGLEEEARDTRGTPLALPQLFLVGVTGGVGLCGEAAGKWNEIAAWVEDARLARLVAASPQGAWARTGREVDKAWER